jgi:hypothetical protein
MSFISGKIYELVARMGTSSPSFYVLEKPSWPGSRVVCRLGPNEPFLVLLPPSQQQIIFGLTFCFVIKTLLGGSEVVTK